MDRHSEIRGDNLGVAAKKAQDFLLGEGVWDLWGYQRMNKSKSPVSVTGNKGPSIKIC